MKKRAVAITTYDNPYDPIEDFVHWFIYDESQGYSTTSYLGRLVNSDEVLTDEEATQVTEMAIDEIICYDFQGIYKKIVKEIDEDLLTASA